MMPTLKIPRDALKSNGFINGYIKDEMRDVQYEDCIYLLFKPPNVDLFSEFLSSEYERTEQVIEDYDYPKGFVVVVYKLDEKFSSDFELVKQGKYSKTSPDFQSQFPKVIKIMVNGLHRDEISLQHRVFRRADDLVKFWEKKFDVVFESDQEIWHGFIEERETLTKNVLSEYEKLFL